MKVLMAGSKGQAKDIICGFFLDNYVSEVVIFDDVSDSFSKHFLKSFNIIKTENEVRNFFKESRDFIVTIASPTKRKMVSEKLTKLGGRLINYLSPKALIYDPSKISGKGVIIQLDCIVGYNVCIDNLVLVNVKTIIESDVSIGEGTTIAPNVLIQKGVIIGENCIISTGVNIMPDVKIGDNVKIWKNKVVDSDVPSNVNLV